MNYPHLSQIITWEKNNGCHMYKQQCYAHDFENVNFKDLDNIYGICFTENGNDYDLQSHLKENNFKYLQIETSAVHGPYLHPCEVLTHDNKIIQFALFLPSAVQEEFIHNCEHTKHTLIHK
jgi:hypothetical protein